MAEELASFLAKPAGRTLVLRLAASKPLFSSMRDANVRLVESGRAEGYDEALAKLISHTEFRREEPSSATEDQS